MGYLWMTAFILQQLLSLCFAITYSWQLSSSKKSLVGKKSHPYIYTDIFLTFSLTNACLLCWLRKAYAVLWAANRFVGSETPKHNDLDNFGNLNFISNTISSFDGTTNYLYLFTFSWPGKCPSSQLKVTKIWFGPNIKYLSEPFLVNFCCREGVSCNY